MVGKFGVMKEIARIQFISPNSILEDFIVHFSDREYDVAFEVYAVSNGEQIYYIDKEDNQECHTEFSENTALKKMEGLFRWRGVWDERIYFPNDEEYWGSDFIKLCELYKDHIIPYCRDYIKNKEPEYNYDN